MDSTSFTDAVAFRLPEASASSPESHARSERGSAQPHDRRDPPARSRKKPARQGATNSPRATGPSRSAAVTPLSALEQARSDEPRAARAAAPSTAELTAPWDDAMSDWQDDGGSIQVSRAPGYLATARAVAELIFSELLRHYGVSRPRRADRNWRSE